MMHLFVYSNYVLVGGLTESCCNRMKRGEFLTARSGSRKDKGAGGEGGGATAGTDKGCKMMEGKGEGGTQNVC